MNINLMKSIVLILAILLTTSVSYSQKNIKWRHGAAVIGDLKYEAGFAHFDYVNPKAPKGGELRLSASGSFDTLNPVPSKGNIVFDLNPKAPPGLVIEPLLISSKDEISSEYGLLAEGLAYPEDYSWVSYKLRANAKWHDGMPVTPEDVIFSFNSFVAHNPDIADYYKHVISAEKTGAREVTFTFDEKNNRELPKILGQLLILPKHWWQGKDKDGNQRDISATTLEPVLGSGPYRIANVNPGSSIDYERVQNYWGAEVNVNIGQYNFDRIQYTYYSDINVEFEAFKANEFDYWSENEAKRWATGYDFPAFNDGKIIRKILPNAYRRSGLMIGFIPNARRDKFKDSRVRGALNLAYDFEEQNRTLFYNSYQRINSYFFGTNLASKGLPTGRELKILQELRGQIPPRVFTEDYRNPVGGTPQKRRENLRKALELFKAAGYKFDKGKMVNAVTGEPFTFEILLGGPTIEKVALPFVQNLKRLGIDVEIRTVDRAQYTNRVRSHDYDMIYLGWAQSLSPGNEQLSYWGSGAVNQQGSSNYAGISDPAIDKLINKIIFAKDRDDLVITSRALDRVLLAHNFVIPTYTLRASRIAYWDRFSHMEDLPTYSTGFPHLWWSKSVK